MEEKKEEYNKTEEKILENRVEEEGEDKDKKGGGDIEIYIEEFIEADKVN